MRYKFSIGLPIIINIFILALIIPAYSDYHYASHSGNNTYPYTSWQTAADSIQKAINAASAGDTIYVGSGVWEGCPCSLRTDLALIGMGMDSTTIRRSSASQYMLWLPVRGAHRTRIEGFTINGVNGAQGIYGYADSNLVITNNRFTNLLFGISGAYVTGKVENNIFSNNQRALEFGFDACSLLVKNNLFLGCIESATITSNGGSWFVTNNIFAHNRGTVSVITNSPGDTALVANNLFYNNDRGLGYYFGNLQIVGQPIVNNTFVGRSGTNRPTAIQVFAWQDTQVTKSINNTFSNFEIGYYFFDGEVEASYTNYWQLHYTGVPEVRLHMLEGNIFSDPMFSDTTSFQLQMFSPLIDAGDPNILDVDGTRSDIGVYGGPGGSSYAYIDYPPARPDSISATIEDSSVYIIWRYNSESDFNRYQIYRDTLSGFSPSAFNLLSEPDTSVFLDLGLDISKNYYYRIAAIDDQDNMSSYSDELGIVFVGIRGFEDPGMPRMSQILSNYPNPFNSQTIINYHLADIGYQPAEVRLSICDISGRLIKTLVDTRQHPGSYRVSWDGTDGGGESVSSGLYFARLTVSGIELYRAQKIMLVR